MFRSSDDMIFSGKIGGSEEPISSSILFVFACLSTYSSRLGLIDCAGVVNESTELDDLRVDDFIGLKHEIY